VGSENWELEREDGFVAEELWTTQRAFEIVKYIRRIVFEALHWTWFDVDLR
jgi:hypothetical protein